MQNDYQGDLLERNIAFRFDGVICRGSGEWKGVASIPDNPAEGIRDLFKKLRSAGFVVTVCTERAASLAGRNAVIAWLSKHHLIEFVSEVTNSVPICKCLVDDKAICFTDVQGLFWKIVNFDAYREGLQNEER